MSAVDVTLLAFAAECRAAALCCDVAAAGRPAAAAIDQYLLSAQRSSANPPRLRSNDGTDRQTDKDRRSTVS